MTYRDELTKAMTMLGQRDDAVFLGQAVAVPGTGMSETFAGVPPSKLIELPVFENTQLGMATGMALAGYLPICVFPRWNFLLAACDQLVNHLDKYQLMGNGWRPKVIIRVAVPTDEPMNPGVQHLGNHSGAFRMMCDTIKIVELHYSHQIRREYDCAVSAAIDYSTIMVEYVKRYNDE